MEISEFSTEAIKQRKKKITPLIASFKYKIFEGILSDEREIYDRVLTELQPELLWNHWANIIEGITIKQTKSYASKKIANLERRGKYDLPEFNENELFRISMEHDFNESNKELGTQNNMLTPEEEVDTLIELDNDEKKRAIKHIGETGKYLAGPLYDLAESEQIKRQIIRILDHLGDTTNSSLKQRIELRKTTLKKLEDSTVLQHKARKFYEAMTGEPLSDDTLLSKIVTYKDTTKAKKEDSNVWLDKVLKTNNITITELKNNKGGNLKRKVRGVYPNTHKGDSLSASQLNKWIDKYIETAQINA